MQSPWGYANYDSGKLSEMLFIFLHFWKFLVYFYGKMSTNFLIPYFFHSQEARGCYVYFIAKLTELLDTIFFVLRKKDNQVSFLHLYHHTVMPMISWGCTKYFPGGHGTFIGVINSFVHIVMYFYYMLAAMGPEFQKYLWWKHWITNLQMVSRWLADNA